MADIGAVERDTAKFRLFAVLAVALGAYSAGPGVDSLGLAVLTVAYLLYLAGLHVVLSRGARPRLLYPMIVIDAVLLGAAAHLTGGSGSLLLVLFPLVVPFYALYSGFRSAILSATAMVAAYLWLQAVDGRSLLTPSVLLEVSLFYLLAMISGYLAQGRLRRRAEHDALQRLTRLESSAQSLAAAARTIQEASDLGAVLQELVDEAPRLTGLPACLVSVLDRKSGALVARATTSDRVLFGVERIEDIVEWPTGHSISTGVLRDHEPLALRDEYALEYSLPWWALKLGPQALLAVPLSARGIDVGVVYYYGVPVRHIFSDQEVTLAQSFADVAALAAVNAQLYEDVQVSVAGVLADLRPVTVTTQPARPRRLPVLEVDGLAIDLVRKEAKLGSQPLNLTPTEFDLLAVLAESPGRTVDQETLLRRVWGEGYRGRSTVVDVGMHRLRRKIEVTPGTPRRIVTVRGSGYMLVPAAGVARQ